MSPAPAFAALLAGLLLGLSLIVAIGAQNLFVLRQGLQREHVLAVVALCTTLDIVLMTIGVTGVGAALARHPRALRGVAGAGAIFLVAYGAAAARRALAPQVLQAVGAAAVRPLPVVLLQGLAISLLNPHVYLDTVLLVGSVGARQSVALRPAFLAGAGLASALWFTALGAGARWLAPLFTRPQAWRVLDGAVAATMTALGVWLAAGAWA